MSARCSLPVLPAVLAAAAPDSMAAGAKPVVVKLVDRSSGRCFQRRDRALYLFTLDRARTVATGLRRACRPSTPGSRSLARRPPPGPRGPGGCGPRSPRRALGQSSASGLPSRSCRSAAVDDLKSAAFGIIVTWRPGRGAVAHEARDRALRTACGPGKRVGDRPRASYRCREGAVAAPLAVVPFAMRLAARMIAAPGRRPASPPPRLRAESPPSLGPRARVMGPDHAVRSQPVASLEA